MHPVQRTEKREFSDKIENVDLPEGVWYDIYRMKYLQKEKEL